MAKGEKPAVPQSARLTADQLREGIQKIGRRIADLDALKGAKAGNLSDEAERITNKINATLREVFGQETVEFNEYSLDWSHFFAIVLDGTPADHRLANFQRGIESALNKLRTTVEVMTERLHDADAGSGPKRALRAYEGLDLHPEIERAAGQLYRDGHYAHAIEDAMKALNTFVKMRSGRDDLDGTPLMQQVFSPNNPVLRFNDLHDQSDRDEQQGFMMLFTGAVAALRNKRAHKIVHDDPERALEFIAFISLLAKLLDEAKKGPPPVTV
jgi:uncharacterized protein (TIGR02391 family)